MNTANNTIAVNASTTVNASNFFIQEIVIINGLRVPSTPYKSSDNKVLFMGDIIEVAFTNDGVINKEFYRVDMRDGQYMATSKNEDYNTPLWCIIDENDEHIKITNLGSSIANPALLNKIK